MKEAPCTCFENVEPIAVQLSVEQLLTVLLALQGLSANFDTQPEKGRASAEEIESTDSFRVAAGPALHFVAAFHSLRRMLNPGIRMGPRECHEFIDVCLRRAATIFVDTTPRLQERINRLPYCPACRARGAPEFREWETIDPDIGQVSEEEMKENALRWLKGKENDG